MSFLKAARERAAQRANVGAIPPTGSITPATPIAGGFMKPGALRAAPSTPTASVGTPSAGGGGSFSPASTDGSLDCVDATFDLPDDDSLFEETVVYVDGSYFEQTNQAGCGVYFAGAVTSHRYMAAPFTIAPLNSLRAELHAAYVAAKLFFEHPLPESQRVTSNKRLLIKQDCSKAINMLLFCKQTQKNVQFQQRSKYKELLFLRRQIKLVEEALVVHETQQKDVILQKTEERIYQRQLIHSLRDGRSYTAEDLERVKAEEEVETRRIVESLHLSLSSDMVSRRSALDRLRTDLATFYTTFGNGKIPTGTYPPSLTELFGALPPEQVMQTHDKYTITAGDLMENRDLLEPLISLTRIFPIRLRYVAAHQVRPAQHLKQELQDWRGNAMADALAKQGSRLSVPQVISEPPPNNDDLVVDMVVS